MTADLAVLTEVEARLHAAESIQDFVDVADMAAVAVELAKRGHLGVRAQNQAVEYRVRAYSGAADLIDALDLKRGSKCPRPGTLPPSTTVQRWRDARTAHRSGWLDRLDPDTETSLAMFVAEGARIRSGIDPEHGDDWYTPRWLFDSLGLLFDVDVCAPVDPAHRTCPARRHYTEADDGLAQDWAGLVWCNPPYSDAAPWVAKWLEHGDGLLLTHIPANARWAVDVWRQADTAVWLQALEFARPNGQTYRPGYALQLAGIGPAADHLAKVSELPKGGTLWGRVL